MDITNLTSPSTALQQNQAGRASGTGAAPNGSGSSELGQKNFLQLLVAQMKNQDPINPMDGKDMASQLAQFNSVEQLISVNEGLKSLQQGQEMMRISMNNSMATSLTGKPVRALSNRVQLGAGQNPQIQFKLKSSADQAEIIIRSAGGTEVRRETLENLGAGDNSWSWDGKSTAGIRMADGEYTVEIAASNGDEPVNALAFVEGIAKKIRYTENGVFLSVNNIEVPIGDVEEVGSVPPNNNE